MIVELPYRRSGNVIRGENHENVLLCVKATTIRIRTSKSYNSTTAGDLGAMRATFFDKKALTRHINEREPDSWAKLRLAK